MAVAARPLATLLIFGLICRPARWAVRRVVKEGRLKRFLLFRIHDDF